MLKEFYEKFYSNLKIPKIEKMKQHSRLGIIHDFARSYEKLNKNVLIVGCGRGEDTSKFEQKVIAFDLAFNAIRQARENFPKNIYLIADTVHLPFIEDYFDCIVCSEVIEHIAQPQQMLAEFHRVLHKQGGLIITTPNWISWYGLVRKVGEFILRKPITAANQPIDNWYTLKTLRRQLESNFSVKEIRGVWYYPPTGRGRYVIPDFLILPIFRFFLPLNNFLGKIFPSIGGHILAVRCVKKEKS